MLDELSLAKLKLLLNGVRLSPEVLKRFLGYRNKRASLSEGVYFILENGKGERAEVNVAVHERFVKKSPFFYDENTGCITDEKTAGTLVYATLIEQPSWYTDKLYDGILLGDVVQIHKKNILATALTNFCDFKESGSGCSFCALGADSSSNVIKNPALIADAVKKLAGLGHEFSEININAGTLLDRDDGMKLYEEVIRGVRKISGMSIYAQITPPGDFNWIKRLHEAGLNTISFNLEIFDDEARARYMPGKSRIPVSRYMDAFKFALPIFGLGQVSSWLIAGLEPPESTIAGMDAIAGAGAIPFVTVFRPLLGTPLENLPPPTLDGVVCVFERLGEIMKEKGLDPLTSRGGCVNCNCCSLLAESGG